MLSTRISTPLSTSPTTEDIFSSALSTLFTDDTQNSHGVPGSSITYHSPRFEDISLRIPSHPDVEEGRKLFAHYLWNAGVIVADAVEGASDDPADGGGEKDDGGDKVKRTALDWDRRYWDVRGKTVLELGAATALPSLIAALSGASTVVITDHPSSPALTTGAIEQNVRENITGKKPGSIPAITTKDIQILGHAWGTTKMYRTESYGKPADPQPSVTSFNRIIIADCLWMPSQHANIVKTILRYLVEDDKSDSSGDRRGYALVVAGFHTGRAIVSNFFWTATGEWKVDEGDEEKVVKEEEEDPQLPEVWGRLKAVEMFEIDVDGNKRSWQAVRKGESKEQAKRWCVCAVLTRT